MSRTCALSPQDLFLLDLACKPIVDTYGHRVYLVGSAMTTSTPRDIDVRLILSDKKYDRLIPTPEIRTMLSVAFAAYLRSITGLPIDFGIQRQTEANALHPGPRNPLGHRQLAGWTGDAPPGEVTQSDKA